MTVEERLARLEAEMVEVRAALLVSLERALERDLDANTVEAAFLRFRERARKAGP